MKTVKDFATWENGSADSVFSGTIIDSITLGTMDSNFEFLSFVRYEVSFLTNVFKNNYSFAEETLLNISKHEEV